jgi:hypothetical protein
MPEPAITLMQSRVDEKVPTMMQRMLTSYSGQSAGLNQDAQLRIWESRTVHRSGDSGFAQTRAAE